MMIAAEYPPLRRSRCENKLLELFVPALLVEVGLT